jgi:hypothetical protein
VGRGSRTTQARSSVRDESTPICAARPPDSPSHWSQIRLVLTGSASGVTARHDLQPNSTGNPKFVSCPAQLSNRLGASPHQVCRPFAHSPFRPFALLGPAARKRPDPSITRLRHPCFISWQQLSRPDPWEICLLDPGSAGNDLPLAVRGSRPAAAHHELPFICIRMPMHFSKPTRFNVHPGCGQRALNRELFGRNDLDKSTREFVCRRHRFHAELVGRLARRYRRIQIIRCIFGRYVAGADVHLFLRDIRKSGCG